MLILAIDTSCDETSVAVVDGFRVLSNVIYSQVKLHEPFGGVFPTIAKREHLTKIDPAINLALKKARLSLSEITALAVTFGPGLAPALEVGLTRAKQLALKNQMPLIAVNHLEGHIYSAFLQNRAGKPERSLHYPFLSLVASGGHTEIVLVKNQGIYQIIGQTLDDAVGESLDKAAKMLGLGYPGGPIIERLAKAGNPDLFSLPIPMLKSGDLNYSYSGLKTAFKRLVDSLSEKDKNANLNHLSAAFQKTAFRHLLDKFAKSLEIYQPKFLTVGGGVTDNRELRKQLRVLAKKHSLTIYLPYFQSTSGDNAAMIGLVAGLKFTEKRYLKTEREIEGLDRQPRASL
jgi:N6-L-threonylcarbamoyladenine synthase